MRHLTRGMIAFAALCGSAFAQDLTGTWQGTLNVPGPQARDLRLVIKIARNNDALQGTFYSIDQGGQSVPVNPVTLQGSTVKMAIPGISGSYEGKLEAGGNSITGTFTQGGPLPLNLTRATPETAWAIPEPPPPPVQIAANAAVHVEVATVKPASPDARGRLYTFRGDQVQAINVSVMNMTTFAYDMHERQVSGLPAWASDEKYDIAIKPDTPGQPNLAQMKKLFQEVLADRFQLKFHPEKRQISVYAIMLPAGKEHKLTKSAAQGALPSLAYPRPGMLPARNATMVELAQSMQTAVLDRPVVDQTGIEGRYDFMLDWMPDETQFASFGPLPQLPDTGKPNIFDAFQQQLGLKLEAVRAPADVMVIDNVARPSDN